MLFCQRMQGRGRILLIDDEPPVLLTYTMILQRQGYDIIAAATAGEAREALRNHQFDVVICDLSIEGENGGFPLLEQAMQQNPAVTAILLTGYASEEQADEANAKGFTLLFKPIAVEDLLRAVSSKEPGEQQRSA